MNNCFPTFIEVLKDQTGEPHLIEDNLTSVDFLEGFNFETRTALIQNEPASHSTKMNEMDSISVGQLIATFESVVGYYASIYNVISYHHPGAKAEKKATGNGIDIQILLLTCFI